MSVGNKGMKVDTLFIYPSRDLLNDSISILGKCGPGPSAPAQVTCCLKDAQYMNSSRVMTQNLGRTLLRDCWVQRQNCLPIVSEVRVAGHTVLRAHPLLSVRHANINDQVGLSIRRSFQA